MSGIAHISAALPSRLAPVGSLPETRELSEADRVVFEGLGIETVGADGSSAVDMAVAAGRSLLQDTGLEPTGVDALLVVQSRVPDMLMTSEATRIQTELGMSGALTFSVSDLGCVSINAAIITARGLLGSGAVSNVVVVHGSTPPAPRRFRRPVTINGEGGIAALLTRDAPMQVLDVALQTNGDYWDLFRVEYRDKPTADWTESCRSLKEYSFKLAVESRNRFRELNGAVMDRCGVKAGDVDHWIMQNLSDGAFRFYEEAFGISFTKSCRQNLSRCGHLGSADVLFNLQTAVASDEISAGELVCVMNNSPSAAWSTMLIRT
ncbi:MAG TPA: 3-oxoacyl-[acyl-carrier-protein] synthase III C-terminal domain-containing protein [Actinomycetota bacterium]|nr:3-oxoacyl-[acyl-carrier-protein] synthase III C-terminal domain-containing protein [Actinomycetota bacterium]